MTKKTVRMPAPTMIEAAGQAAPKAEITVPGDRIFRNAWRINGAAVTVDMAAARKIHRNALRAARAPLLQALDVEWMRAIEAGDQAAIAEIAGRKDKLRDVTTDHRIDAAATPDELKALTLDRLMAG